MKISAKVQEENGKPHWVHEVLQRQEEVTCLTEAEFWKQDLEGGKFTVFEMRLEGRNGTWIFVV